MNTPNKSYVSTGSKTSNRPVGLKSNTKHTTNPTSSSGNTGATMGVNSLHGAQGSKGKYC